VQLSLKDSCQKQQIKQVLNQYISTVLLIIIFAKNLFMKKIIMFVFVVLLGISAMAQSKAGNKLPSANVKTLDGKTFNTSEISNDGKPILIAFWALWCKPCKKELDAYNEVYEDWQDETGVKLIAISQDDDRTARRIKPMVNGKAWDYEIYHDYNEELKRAFNIASIPYMIIIKNGEIVETRTGYTPGTEEEIYQIIKE